MGMSLLNFGDDKSAAPRSKKPLKLILGIGALAGVIALSSTLAANINLNTGNPVEFGQGLAQTVVCGGSDVSIIITPKSTFRNETGAGSYRFSSFLVSNIPSQCNGIDFTFKFYGATGGPLDPIHDRSTYPRDFNNTDIKVHFAGVDTTGIGSNNLWDVNDFGFPDNFNGDAVNGGSPADSRTSSSFEVTFWYSQTDGPGLLADEVKKITVESRSSSFYYPSGPQENVAKSTVTNGGWTQCWSGSYGTGGTANDALSFIQSSCTGRYLMYTGWENSSPNNLILLAAAPRSDVFRETLKDTPGLSNGTYWYYLPGTSIGFSAYPDINQTPCDDPQTETETDTKRLCWHAYADSSHLSEGWRLGSIYRLGYTGDSQDGNLYTRAIYQHNQ